MEIKLKAPANGWSASGGKSQKPSTRDQAEGLKVALPSPFISLVRKDSIRYLLQAAVADVLEGQFKAGLDLQRVQLEHPANEAFGDYSTNVAMVLSKDFKKSPRSIADEVKRELEENGKLNGLVSAIEVAGSGFVNFKLSQEWLLKEVKKIVEQGDDYGRAELGKGHQEMVEFNQANTNKHFHVGHLRNTSLGESLSRLLEFGGFRVWRTSYQGDIGLHLAKTIWAIQDSGMVSRIEQLEGEDFMDFISDIYVKGAKAYKESREVKEIVDNLNKEIYEARKLETGTLYEIWWTIKDKALRYFDVLYNDLGTFFDKLYFDSDVIAGKEDVLKGLEERVFEESEGAVIFRGEKYGLHTRVFINSKGVPTYDAKDIRLAKMKADDFRFEHCIFVIGEEQKEYLKVIFKILELMGRIKDGEYFHRYYGLVNLGEKDQVIKMSSRLGNVVTLVDLVGEAKGKIVEYLESSGKKYPSAQKDRIVEKVAVGALKYSMLKVEPEKSIVFDLDKSVSFTGDSGPYLQYTYARARSILRKADFNRGVVAQFIARSRGGERELTPAPFDVGSEFAITEEGQSLLRLFYKFPEVVNEAMRFLEPHRLCPFLIELAQRFNTFYQKVPVLKAKSDNERDLRLLLTASAAQIIRNGLYLLGIEVLEGM